MTATRTTLSLDGLWGIAEGDFEVQPDEFPSSVPVPGMADLAEPAFENVGVPDVRREAFWYRRTFALEGSVPEVAILRIGKATYGTKVFLNGTEIGEHLPNFTPGHFDVCRHLIGDGGENQLVVRVGATRDATPPSIATGWDMELYRSTPGIYDSVELVMSGSPHIELVRTRPNIEDQSVTVFATVANGAEPQSFAIQCEVSEAETGQPRGRGDGQRVDLAAHETRELEITVPIDDMRTWSPEDPYLYEVEVTTPGDSVRTRFGMRSFTFDPNLNRALLNGEIYFLRGTHAIFFRLLEDPARTTQPWDEDWVRRLFRQFKSMNWNSVRNALGFPPEMWYRVADEEGLLIIDEFPLFYPLPESVVAPKRPEGEPLSFGEELNQSSAQWAAAMEGTPWPEELTAERLAIEYAEWIDDRANHASVVAFSAQCECPTPVTGEAVMRVRHRDVQARPWGNGWGGELEPHDFYDAHWYPEATWCYRETIVDTSGLGGIFKTPREFPRELWADERILFSINDHPNHTGNATLTSEYGWNWLCRDGTPALLSAPVYRRLADAGYAVDTPDQRFELRARILSAQTEFLRGNRTVAGILQQCGIAAGQPGAFTTDNFVDFDTLEFHPHFVHYMRDALNPVGIMVDFWKAESATGRLEEVPVAVVNDTSDTWQGVVTLRLLQEGITLWEAKRTVRVAAAGQDRVIFYLQLPDAAGQLQLQGELSDEGGLAVSSWRDFRTVSTV